MNDRPFSGATGTRKRSGAELSAARRVEAERSTLLIDPLDDVGKSRVRPYFRDGGESKRQRTGEVRKRNEKYVKPGTRSILGSADFGGFSS